MNELIAARAPEFDELNRPGVARTAASQLLPSPMCLAEFASDEISTGTGKSSIGTRVTEIAHQATRIQTGTKWDKAGSK